MEHTRLNIRIPSMDLKNACVVAYSDASFGSMPRQGSQGGCILLVADKRVAETTSKAADIEWKSHRLKRVVKSILAAEAAALSEAHDHLVKCRLFENNLYANVVEPK